MAKAKATESRNGLPIQRLHTQVGSDPLDNVIYEIRQALITEANGQVVFAMDEVEVPIFWSQLATDILASKYFRKTGVPNSPSGSEYSIRQVLTRIVNTIRQFGESHGYFESANDAKSFADELTYLLVHQHAAFNSPVWFNCGLHHQYGISADGHNFAWDFANNSVTEVNNIYERPPCSACFIQSVEDSLDGIFELVKTESKLFKYGAGTGSNFSILRSKYESIASGGTSSGVMSFLEVFDRAAGATKSGGTTRRAAKMVVLNVDHPEILDFIQWKAKEEQKAQALIQAGYNADFNHDAYHTVAGQNANNSVRLNKAFMTALQNKGVFSTVCPSTKKEHEQIPASVLMQEIAQAAYHCADPGVQFDDHINEWHTCPNGGRINASNPCSEFHFLDDTACNLASINLLKYYEAASNSFDIDGFTHACKILLIAQDILVDLSSYPTRKIAENSHQFRPLGLGYSNLGALLMQMGLPYDSAEARAIAASITALMTGQAYSVSAGMAAHLGAFEKYADNKKPMLAVIQKHIALLDDIPADNCPVSILGMAKEVWEDAYQNGKRYGYRNAQVSVLAPTGTISFLMDCDTTGIEPEYALVKTKKLSGGGTLKLVNRSVSQALSRLGYKLDKIAKIQQYLMGCGTLDGAPFFTKERLYQAGFRDKDILDAFKWVEVNNCFTDFTDGITPSLLLKKGFSENEIDALTTYVNGCSSMDGAPFIKPEHLAVFDCAVASNRSGRMISADGHIEMMVAVQPFLSGAISKTVNLPNSASVEDIQAIYVSAWQKGLKSIALYRDGCKQSQPLSTVSTGNNLASKSKKTSEQAYQYVLLENNQNTVTTHMPESQRQGTVIETQLNGQTFVLRASQFEDGSLADIDIDLPKADASYRALLSCFGLAVSIGLQHGIPLTQYQKQFESSRFEPAGLVSHKTIKRATSPLDLAFRLLANNETSESNILSQDSKSLTNKDQLSLDINISQALTLFTQDTLLPNTPPCNECGFHTIRSGSCFRCLNCGHSSACSG